MISKHNFLFDTKDRFMKQLVIDDGKMMHHFLSEIGGIASYLYLNSWRTIKNHSTFFISTAIKKLWIFLWMGKFHFAAGLMWKSWCWWIREKMQFKWIFFYWRFVSRIFWIWNYKICFIETQIDCALKEMQMNLA
jgi:hypothetical protein